MKNILRFIILSILISCEIKSENSFDLDEGVSQELATFRKKQISDVRYGLSFKIPQKREDSIVSKLDLKLSIHDLSMPLYLDFKSDKESPKVAIVNGKDVSLAYEKEHLIIPAKYLVMGNNTIEIAFIAGEMSLNRNEDYLFTLLVPDRARTLFPCFDQPNIKATYLLDVSAPADWNVLCGAPVEAEQKNGGFVDYQFKETDKMSTYLFSFVAGKFNVAESGDPRFKMLLFHQEKDSMKVELSTSRIFELHQQSVDFLETYTAYDFPFQKLDYAAIFTHPYGGMEHTGAIQYRQSALFLDNTATQNQKLRRAKLIAHETAHMWFGNLVTMQWFNDVWLKEVFANFMADIIVNPVFEDINHELSFLLSHYPAAYEIDRSKGANPIRQQLNNLNDAGSLYGSIIYHKAPIMMRQLEAIVGKDKFQKGVAQYVSRYANDNADWNDLINILDTYTEVDLKEWSNVWVNSPSRPIITSIISYDDSGNIQSFQIDQKAEDGSKNTWTQVFELSLVYPDSVHVVEVDLKGQKHLLTSVEGLAKPEFITYNSDGMGYGVFPINPADAEYVPKVRNEVARASIYLNSYENALTGKLPVTNALDIILEGLKTEQNELIESLLSRQATHLFWTYFSEEDKLKKQEEITEILFKRLQQDEKPGIKKTLFNTFRSLAYRGASREQLYKIWNKELTIPNLSLNQDDYTRIAMQLAIYEHPSTPDILQEAKEALKDKNKIERFDFLLPALSTEEDVRNTFFQSFANAENREKENWVLSACYYIHHPLRQSASITSLDLSLSIIEEIQQTGDIFFPKGWLDNTIGMYTSDKARTILTEFLKANPNLNPQLRLKILQATDDLVRAKDINSVPLLKRHLIVQVAP